MEPHRMIEAGHLHLAVGPTDAVRKQCSIEQGHVAGVGDDARMEHVVIGKLAVGSHPHLLTKPWVSFAGEWVGVDVPNIDRSWPVVPFAQLLLEWRHASLEVG